jgi:hypothetical protein
MFFKIRKDGGPESTVTGYFLTEIKSLATIALLRFGKGSRENYHSHAFDSISWVIKGELEEHMLDGTINSYKPSLKPVFTKKSTFHKVYGKYDTNLVVTFRGPWCKTWNEYNKQTSEIITLKNGRKQSCVKQIQKESYLTKEEVATFLNTSTEYVDSLVNQHKLKIKKEGKSVATFAAIDVIQLRTEEKIRQDEAIQELVRLTEKYGGYDIN